MSYKALPAVVDPERARQEGAPLVHADVPRNVAARLDLSTGDVDAAFGEAEVVLCERFSTEQGAGLSIEPRAVVARPGGQDGEDDVAVTLWDSTQAPHVVRRGVAQALGLPEERVRVITPDVGGAFGPKGRLYPEEIVLAALALRLGRPVSWEAACPCGRTTSWPPAIAFRLPRRERSGVGAPWRHDALVLSRRRAGSCSHRGHRSARNTSRRRSRRARGGSDSQTP